jgi:hypothetical protein
MVLLAVMVVGEIQKGHGAVVVRMEAGHACRVRGALVSGGVNDPDVCGL